MSQDDVLAAFREPDEELSWNEILDRCEGKAARRSIEQAIMAARRTQKIKVVRTEKTGRRGRSVLVYALVVP